MSVDLRLAIPAACGWIAAIVVVGMPEIAGPAVVATWAATGVLTALAIAGRRRWFAVGALAAAAAALCCSSIAVREGAREPAELADAAAAGRTVTVVAATTQVAEPGRGSYEVELIRDGGDVPALVLGEGPAERLGIGTRVQLRGTLAVASPGDHRAFLLFPEGPPEVLAGPPAILDWANGLRERFLAVTQRLPGEGGDLLPGLAIGDTSAVGDELDAAMKTSSLSHLTAVSGANCAVVIGLVLAGGRALALPRTVRLVCAVAMLLVFVVLVTPEPSVLRAAVMAGLVLFALLGGRPVRGVPVLALSVLALLVNDPWLARDFGFALSVLATAGLLLLAEPLAGALARWLPRWLAVVVAVPVAAQLACQPVLILLDASLPTYGVVANLLAAPAAPLATVIGLAACVAAALVPPLGACARRARLAPGRLDRRCGGFLRERTRSASVVAGRRARSVAARCGHGARGRGAARPPALGVRRARPRGGLLRRPRGRRSHRRARRAACRLAGRRLRRRPGGRLPRAQRRTRRPHRHGPGAGAARRRASTTWASAASTCSCSPITTSTMRAASTPWSAASISPSSGRAATRPTIAPPPTSPPAARACSRCRAGRAGCWGSCAGACCGPPRGLRASSRATTRA